MNTIETDRPYFREIVESDDYSILELDSDPDVHQYLGNRGYDFDNKAFYDGKQW